MPSGTKLYRFLGIEPFNPSSDGNPPAPVVLVASNVVNEDQSTVTWTGGRGPAAIVDWGDGTSEVVTQPATHYYADNGTYLITVRAPEDPNPAPIDPAALAGTEAVIDTAAQAAPVLTAVQVEGTLQVTLNIAGGDAERMNNVDWGDGTIEDQPGSSTDLTHTYGAAAEYTIEVDPEGFVIPAATTTVVVEEVVVVPDPIVITATVTDDMVDVSWTGDDGPATIDFGDGTVLDNTMPTKHWYAANGDYTITVTPDNTEVPGNTADVTIAATEGAAPTLTATQVGNTLEVTLTIAGGDPERANEINWGDGSALQYEFGTVTEVSHTYDAEGDYTITVDPRGFVFPAGTTDVSVAVSNPVVVTVTSTEGDAEATWTGDDGPATIDWGDGSAVVTGATSPATYTYAENGTFTVTVTPDNTDADPGTDDVTIAITPPPASVEVTVVMTDDEATISWTGDDGPARVKFSDGVADFENGLTSPVTHFYDAVGDFNVTVTPDNTDVAAGTAVATVADVAQLPPPPDITIVQDGDNELRTLLTFNSPDTRRKITMNWGDVDSGDVSYAGDTVELSRIYDGPGTFTVTVDYEGRKYATRTADITLTVTPVITVTPTVTDDLVSLTSDVEGSAQVDWGDGSDPETYVDGMTHYYDPNGDYTITVTPATGDPGTADVTINVTPVDTMSITAVQIEGTLDVEVTQTGADPARVSQVYWNDNSGEEFVGGAVNPVPHTFPEAGDYLITFDPIGALYPKVETNITVEPVTPAVVLSTTVTDNVVELSWTGDDGPATVGWGDDPNGEDNVTSPATHTYDETGTFSILVDPDNPDVEFARTDVTIENVPIDPIVVNPTVTEDRVAVGWSGYTGTATIDYGDGTVVNSADGGATHYYDAAGDYTITVTPDDTAVPGNTADVSITTTEAGVAAVAASQPFSDQLDLRITITGGEVSRPNSVDWGDGTVEEFPGSQNQPTHTYAAEGEKSITVDPLGVKIGAGSTTFNLVLGATAVMVNNTNVLIKNDGSGAWVDIDGDGDGEQFYPVADIPAALILTPQSFQDAFAAEWTNVTGLILPPAS